MTARPPRADPNTRPPRRIGVLGGMGPEATVVYMQRVIALTHAADDADHIPLIVDSNTQVPSRIAALIDGTGEDPTPTLTQMARKLEAYGAEALAMPCNTAHAYHAPVAAAVDIPFINMVALSAEVAGKISKSARIGMLASPATRLARVFDAPMDAVGLVPLWPREEAPILAAIRAIKRSSRDASARAAAEHAVRELAAAGCGAVLIACSEFSIIAEDLAADIPLIDTIDVLAAATVALATAD